MLRTAADQTQKCQNHYKREFQTIGKAFLQLGQAMEQDNNHGKLFNFIQGCSYEDLTYFCKTQ